MYKTMSEFQVYNENVVRQQVEEFNELAKKKQYTTYEITSITPYSKMDSFSAIIVEEVRKNFLNLKLFWNDSFPLEV